jgi:hypothetical protein
MSLEDGVDKERRKRSGTSYGPFHSHLLILEKGRAMVGSFKLEVQYSRHLTPFLSELDRTETQVHGLPHFLMRAFPSLFPSAQLTWSVLPNYMSHDIVVCISKGSLPLCSLDRAECLTCHANRHFSSVPSPTASTHRVDSAPARTSSWIFSALMARLVFYAAVPAPLGLRLVWHQRPAG